MPYATGRTFLDADSHIMELPDFLTANADRDIADKLPAFNFEAAGVLAQNVPPDARWFTPCGGSSHPGTT